VVVLSLNCDNSYSELGSGFNKRAWTAICLGDLMRDVQTTLRALAADPAQAESVYESVSAEMVRAARHGVEPVLAGIEGWAQRLARIPLRSPAQSARKVLVVGEIFVRRDDYSVETLIAHLAQKGIVAKVTGLGEWIHYLDYEQARKLKRALARMPWLRRPFSSEAFKLAYLKLEMLWKHWAERRLAKPLVATGLIPESPSHMERIMARAEEFATPELESEATLSPCVASTAMEEGWDGVAVIAPFACLPGRLIEALYAPWARARRMPVICLENDGNPYPPNVVSRIEIFAHNVGRGIREVSPGASPPAATLARSPQPPSRPQPPAMVKRPTARPSLKGEAAKPS
jgi:predicted nucleotide-binding protein (sugar kinase/HSP70/actin superfamily)